MYYGQYFDWLCELINLRPGTFDILIEELHTIDFRWVNKPVLELDANRAEDGLVLRSEFYDSCGNQEAIDAISDKPCSVLEALIGLAKKMDYLLDDDDRGDRTRIWFWEMITNLGLNKYSDEYLGDSFARLNQIDSKVNRWLDRSFDPAGFGSPFPLQNPHRDQTKLHMIDQLNDYVLEKYVVNDEIL